MLPRCALPDGAPDAHTNTSSYGFQVEWDELIPATPFDETRPNPNNANNSQ